MALEGDSIGKFGKGGGGGGTVRGAAPGRVREEGTPLAQLVTPEANAFCVEKAPKTTQKAGLLK